MTFSEAAAAYELVQSGASRRFVAEQYGVSHTHLGRIFRQCLEFGKAASYLNYKHLGRPRTVSVEHVKRAMVMRDNGLSWKRIAITLGVDADQLRKSTWHFDERTRKTDGSF
jgi:response regulator of citrate/malate metabolism